MKKKYLICFLQHRENTDFVLTSFLHLHYAIKKTDLINDIKVVFACSNKNPKQLELIKNRYGKEYDIDIFKCRSLYPLKLEDIFNEYNVNHFEYFVKCDEDVFISSDSWRKILYHSSSILNNQNVLLTSVNLSTGIPTWQKFCEIFIDKEVLNNITDFLSYKHIPDQFWGQDYSLLKNEMKSHLLWDENRYWEKMNTLDTFYKGLHPMRLKSKIIAIINDYILKNYDKYLNYIAENDFYLISDRYFCNSFFIIKYNVYQSIVNDKNLKVDIFDEVPINTFRKKNNLSFAILNNSLGLHISYNQSSSDQVLFENILFNGTQLEEYFLKKYTNFIINKIKEIEYDFNPTKYLYKETIFIGLKRVIRNLLNNSPFYRKWASLKIKYKIYISSK